MTIESLRNKKKKEAPNLRYLRDKDREEVRGRFVFNEVPGGELTFGVKLYRDEPYKQYTLKDGEICSLPIGVVKHINKNCWYPEHAYITDENGNSTYKIGRKIQRCSFQSLEFIDFEDIEPAADTDVVAAEKVI